MRTLIFCKTCSNPLYVTPYQLGRKRYCSRRCQGLDKVKTLRNTKPNQTSFKTGENTGRSNHKWVAPIRFTCEYCQNPFELKPWEVRQKARTGGRPRFCCKSCHGLFKKSFEAGQQAPDWVGGPKTYRGRSWSKQRRKAVARDKGRCRNCRRYIGDSIPVHHKRPFREFTDELAANRLSNLICLCSRCHPSHEPRPRS